MTIDSHLYALLRTTNSHKLLGIDVIDLIHSEILSNRTLIPGFVYVLRRMFMHKKKIGPQSIAYKHLEMHPRSWKDLLQLQMWDMEEKQTHRQHLTSYA